jgi:hypothetical protein
VKQNVFNANFIVLEFRVIPNRSVMSPPDVKMKKYSPFPATIKDNKIDYALAKVDDLVNWSRKVILFHFSCLTDPGTEKLHYNVHFRCLYLASLQYFVLISILCVFSQI